MIKSFRAVYLFNSHYISVNHTLAVKIVRNVNVSMSYIHFKRILMNNLDEHTYY